MENTQTAPSRAILKIVKGVVIERPVRKNQVEFKKGQRIRCVNTDGYNGLQCRGVEKGKIYKINYTGKCLCGESFVVLDGIRDDGATSYCICGRINAHGNTFRSSRFELVSLSVTSNEASPRGIKKANTQSENGIDPKVEVLTPKKNKHIDQLNIKTIDHSLYQSHQMFITIKK